MVTSRMRPIGLKQGRTIEVEDMGFEWSAEGCARINASRTALGLR